jgi:hypothetical protein
MQVLCMCCGVEAKIVGPLAAGTSHGDPTKGTGLLNGEA